jgi:predicted ATPase
MDARFVSIVGIGGVGKTTVAIAVGHHLIEAFNGAVLFVDLSMLSDPGLVATTIASMLRMPVRSDDATPALIAYLRGKRMLLILDTCEHLIEVVAAVASQIYAKAPGIHILVTSREVLQIEGEHVYRLETLACPPEDAEVISTEAQAFPAPRLFIQRAAASGARLELSDTDVEIVVRICRKLDGVALAIELAAWRVETYGLQETETLIDQRFIPLLLGHRSATPRQKTLQATLDWSYQLLSELERVVLRRLAVFVGHFTLDASLAIVTGPGVDQSQALGAIESLVRKSMIATRPIGAMMRYRLLDTTRTYVLAIPVDDTEATDLAVRHATYYRQWLEQSGGEWATLSTGPERSSHFAALNNARSALAWCFGEGGDLALGIKLAAAAAPVFLTMLLLTECCRWSQRVIAALDDTTRGGADEMQVQAGLGVALMYIHGPNEAARAALERSLTIAEARGNILIRVAVLRSLSLFSMRQGNFKMSLAHAKHAKAVAGTVDEPDATALAQTALGLVRLFMADYAGASAELEAASQHWSSTHRTFFGVDERISVGIGLTQFLWTQGLSAEAVERIRQTLDYAKLSGNPASVALTLMWLLRILIWVGDFGSAEQHVDWLISHAESHSMGPYLQVGRAFRGVIAIRNGNPQAGIEALRACLKDLREMHNTFSAEFNTVLTQGLIAIGRIDEGMVLIDETIRRADENGPLFILPEALRVKGNIFLSIPQTNSDAAEARFTQSLELSRQQGARAWELRTATDLAELWASQGRSDKARELLSPVFAQFTEGFETADLTAAKRLLTTLS